MNIIIGAYVKLPPSSYVNAYAYMVVPQDPSKAWV